MKTYTPLITKSLLVLSIFSATILITYETINNSGGVFKSTPYQTRSSTADADLNRLTNGSGASILDGVIAQVKAKAEEKAGNPVDAQAYNAYITSYLSEIDKLDNEIKAEFGPDYAFIFQYVYPRVLETKKDESKFTSILERLKSKTTLASTTSVVSSVAAPTPAPTPAPGGSINLSGIPFIVKNYNPTSYNVLFDMNSKSFKFKNLGITFDTNASKAWAGGDDGYSNPFLAEGSPYLLQANDYCKSYGRGYRLPKTYEVQAVLNSILIPMRSSHNTQEADTYELIRNDQNNNVGGGSLFIPTFIPADILDRVMRSTPINGTVALDLSPARGSNLYNALEALGGYYGGGYLLAKNDDGKFFSMGGENLSGAPQQPLASSKVVCVHED